MSEGMTERYVAWTRRRRLLRHRRAETLATSRGRRMRVHTPALHDLQEEWSTFEVLLRLSVPALEKSTCCSVKVCLHCRIGTFPCGGMTEGGEALRRLGKGRTATNEDCAGVTIHRRTDRLIAVGCCVDVLLQARTVLGRDRLLVEEERTSFAGFEAGDWVLERWGLAQIGD